MWWAGVILSFLLSVIILFIDEQSFWLTFFMMLFMISLPCAIVYTIIACIKNYFKAGYHSNPNRWERR